MAVAQGQSVSILPAWVSLHSPQGIRGRGVLALTKSSYGSSMGAASSAKQNVGMRQLFKELEPNLDLSRSFSEMEAIS